MNRNNMAKIMARVIQYSRKKLSVQYERVLKN